MRIAFVLVMSAILGASGCRKKEPNAESKVEEPEKADYVFPKLKPGKKTDGGRDLRCRGDLCEEGTQLPIAPDGSLSVKIERCDDCTLDIAGRKIEAEEGTIFKLDLLNVLGDADTHEVAMRASSARIWTGEGRSSAANARARSAAVA